MLHRNVRIAQLQVGWLVFLMVGVGDEHRREAVEADHAIRFRIGDARHAGRRLQPGVVGVVAQGPGRLAAEQVGVECRIGDATEQAPAEGRTDVAHLAQFRPQPACFEAGPVRQRLLAGGGRIGVGTAQQGVQRCGRFDARFHRRVGALDLRHIEETGRVTHQQAPRKRELRNGLQATLRQRTGAVGNAAATFQQRSHGRMLLEALEFLER